MLNEKNYDLAIKHIIYIAFLEFELMSGLRSLLLC